MEESIIEYYLRIETESEEFGFVANTIHDIQETDIKLTQEDYDRFFELQSSGKQFRLKKVPTPEDGLFGYVEEYTPITEDVTPTKGIEDYLIDLDVRVCKIELGVQ